MVELLYEYFPTSIDKLDPDNGIKDGPKPILFKSGNGHDLIMMLLGLEIHVQKYLRFPSDSRTV